MKVPVELDNPKILLKLRRIFHAFSESRFPTDDTLVEKLNNWLETALLKTGDVQLFIQKTQLTELMQQITNQTPEDPATVAFFLRLLSYIPHMTESNRLHEMTLLLYKEVIQANCSNPCVLNAWLQGLDNMLHKSVSMKDWILAEDLHIMVLSCLQHQGLFVTKSAAELLSSLLVIELQDPSKQHCTQQGSRKLPNSFSELWEKARNDSDVKLTCIQVLTESLKKASKLEAEKLYMEYQLFDKISVILQSCDDSQCAERNQTIKLLTECQSFLQSDEVNQLETLAFSLLQIGSVQTAMTLAQWLLLKCEEKLKRPSLLMQTQFFIIYVIFKPAGQIFEEFDKESLVIQAVLDTKKQSFPSMFLRQLELLVNYSQCKELPLEVQELLLTVLGSLCMSQCSNSSLLVTLYKKQQRIYLALVGALNYIIQKDGSPAIIHRFVSICLDYLTHTHTPTVVQKTLCTVLSCLQHISNSDVEETNNILEKLDVMLQYMFCEQKWECLDSVTEFVTGLLLKIKGSTSLCPIIERVVNSVMQMAEHPESYLRASAINFFGALFCVPTVWKAVITKHSQDDILEKVFSATKDQEAFPRRAAVKALKSVFSLDGFESRRAEVLSIICKLSCDLDWEVKCGCLEFWMMYIDMLMTCGNGSPASIHQQQDNAKVESLEGMNQLRHLLNCGCAEVLVTAAHDCDKTVQHKACQILEIIREKYTHNLVDSMMQNEGWSQNDSDILKELFALDLTKLAELSNQSTDQYFDNAEALLDDLLTSVQEATEMSEADDKDNAIDCY